MRMRDVLSVVVLAASACQFERPADVGTPVDAAPPSECEASTQRCEGELFTQCGDDGRFVRHDVPNGSQNGTAATLVMHEYVCPLGCHATEPRCLDVDPSNGLESVLDEMDAQPPTVDLVIDDPSGTTTIVDLGGPGSTSVSLAFANGTTVTVPAEVWAQPDARPLRVIKVRSLTIAAGSRLKFISGNPVAIVSLFDIRIAGTLDYAGGGNTGTSVRVGCDVGMSFPASAGAGNLTAGGSSSTGLSGGVALTSSPEMVPLEGGCSSTIGIGGGGFQLVSRRRVTLTATGVIDVSGRRGQGVATSPIFVSGGGAGGTLLIEAPGIGMSSGALIIGRGGSGAAGNNVTLAYSNGLSGNHDLQAADVPGGMCPG